MLKYIVVLLGDESVPFCSYTLSKAHKQIEYGTLKSAVLWAMKENLEIQFVYPPYQLDNSILELINTVSHINIMGASCPYKEYGDIFVFNNPKELLSYKFSEMSSCVLRISYKELKQTVSVFTTLETLPNRINFCITDREEFSLQDIPEYETSLNALADFIVEYANNFNKIIQSNILTDRLFLCAMNNCNAGDETITLAPNGYFYICPAFYYNGEAPCGNISTGVSIPNGQLFKLDYAPICSHCDAFQCMRCVWKNKKSTLEVNTPSQGQCYSAHIERKASSYLLGQLNSRGFYIDGMVSSIPILDYLDPLDNKYNW